MDERLMTTGPDLPPDVLDALSRGQKIEAIKRLRESNDMDLKSAKQAIERYERTHAVPKREVVSGMITEDRTSSRLLWIALVLGAAALAYYFYF